MKALEEYEVRMKMAEMHEEFIEKMSIAYDSGFYVETVWYCYSIFEQRISRLIAKYIDKCKLSQPRTNEKTAAISTRIKCLQKLIKAKYGAFAIFDADLLNQVMQWCNNRNELVHGLVSLKHYKKYDEEFKKLAKVGAELVFKLYDECTTFRNHWYEISEPEADFPVDKCRCNNQQCINPKCI